MLPSDCVEEEELLRLRTVWLDIVGDCVVVVVVVAPKDLVVLYAC